MIKYILKIKYFKKAKELISNPERLKETVNTALEKFKKENIDKEREKFKDLFEMAKDYAKGDYRDISKLNFVYLIAAILYFLNPLDIIPDMILAVGFLDDFTVISFVYSKISKEVEKYREWRDKVTIEE